MTLYRSLSLCALSSLVVTACGSSAEVMPEWCTSESGDPLIVFSANDPRPLALREVWRRGGLREGEELARPGTPTIDRLGRVALVDESLGEVVVIGEDGRWLGPVIRQGNGPEDVRAPVAVAWADDGSLLILDFGRMVISRRAVPEGRVVGEQPVSEDAVGRLVAANEIHPSAFSVASTGDLLTEPRARLGDEEDAALSVQLLKYDGRNPESAPTTLMSLETEPLVEGRTWIAPGFPQPLVGLGPRGVVAIAGDTETYRVRILGSSGADSVVICRNAEGVPLTRLELGDTLLDLSATDPAEREREEFRRWLSEATRPPVPLPVGRLIIGSTGRLWIQREREDPLRFRPPGGATYDVFSTAGSYLASVTAPDGVVLYGESQDLVIGYAVGDLDETSVVAFELVWPDE